MKGYLTFSALMAAYVAMCAVPGEWLWFDPTPPVIANSHVGNDPGVTYFRTVKVKSGISFATIIRTYPGAEPACFDNGGPFDYLPSRSGPLSIPLSQWTSSDPRCHALPAGMYYGQVTWTIVNPYRDLLPDWLKPILGGLASIIPPKEVRRDIPLFERLRKEG